MGELRSDGFDRQSSVRDSGLSEPRPSPDAAVRAGGLNRVLVGTAVGLAALSICCCLIVVPWHRWLAGRADINPLYWGDLPVAVVWPAVGPCWSGLSREISSAG